MIKRTIAFIFALILAAGILTGCGSAAVRNCSTSCAEVIPVKAALASAPAPVALSVRKYGPSFVPDVYEPFYGIWGFASKSYDPAEKVAESYRKSGFDAHVILTTDWSNLNSKPYYCVTFGIYSTKAEANAALPLARKYDSSAYVKYSGYWQGSDTPFVPDVYEPFYGIWGFASKSYEPAEKVAESYRKSGFDAHVILTTDWSNLNTKPYYCVTFGIYSTKAEADAALPLARKYDSSAYVKYSGYWQGY